MEANRSEAACRAPRLLLSPTILRARRLAYETAQGTGGSVIGRAGRAELMLLEYEDNPEAFLEKNPPRPKRRDFASSPPEIRKIVGESDDFTGAPPQSRFWGAEVEIRRGHPWGDETERDKAAARAVVEYEDRQRRRGEGRAKL